MIRSYPLHTKRWNTQVFNVEDMSQTAAEWFTNRKHSLNNLVKELEDYVTAIESPKSTENADDFVRKQLLGGRIIITINGGDYTLTGQRIK